MCLVQRPMTIGNTNRGLPGARKAKKDEFYTQLTDIERELRQPGPRGMRLASCRSDAEFVVHQGRAAPG